MKKFINIFIIVSFSMAGCYTTGQVPQGDNYGYSDNYNNEQVSYETFYDQLQPYGNWVNYPEYGNVWRPNMQGFRPYETGGHWVSTVDGWAWESDYNWGWAPFHYGRWFFDQSIGWAWVPGYEWAPAWVTWGQYNDYYAWAPLAPGINISFGNSWRAPANCWSFVPRNYINYSNLNRYASYGNYNTNVNNITIINNYNSYNQKDYYHRGPDYKEVERFTRQPITPVAIASTNRPGLSRVVNKQFQVYRPGILANGNNGNSIRDIKSANAGRTYQGAVDRNGQTGASSNGNSGRNWKNPNLNNLPARNRADGITNGTNNGGTNVTQESIDNTNRQFQEQQIENVRRMRSQTLSTNRTPAQENTAAPQQLPQNNQQIQNDIRRQEMRNNLPSGNNVPPSRPQSRMQDERIMQRPAFPQQNERIMRQPPQAPAMPQRMESRDVNPGRNMQMERRSSGIQRPSRF